jgi:hypothetical protein
VGCSLFAKRFSPEEMNREFAGMNADESQKVVHRQL